jgi:N-acetylglucosamine kinase-like BadF-type ATPase
LLTEDDRGRAIALLKELFPQSQAFAEPDYAAALYASDEGADVCVIAGTGSLVCSRGESGIAKSGGRGYILGDEGSAYQYGKSALLAYLSNPLAASTTLKKCIVDLFDAEDEPTIVSRLYRSPSPQATLAKLAKPLAADARAGSEYAGRSIAENASALAGIVRRHVAQHLSWKKEIRVILSGGLWKTSNVFIEGFAAELDKGDIAYRLERIKTPPVFGAVRLAKEMAIGH